MRGALVGSGRGSRARGRGERHGEGRSEDAAEKQRQARPQAMDGLPLAEGLHAADQEPPCISRTGT
jgi:hypothetical protein